MEFPREQEEQARAGDTQDRTLGTVWASKRKARTQEARRPWLAPGKHAFYKKVNFL